MARMLLHVTSYIPAGIRITTSHITHGEVLRRASLLHSNVAALTFFQIQPDPKG